MDSINIQLEDAWPVMSEQLDAGGTVRFTPKGTSMLPMLRQGQDSVVLTAKPEKLKKYDLPLYRRENGQFVLHRVVDIKDDGYVMCGDNQYVREYGIEHSRILAVAKGFYRGDEYVDCANENYLEYAKKRVANRRRYGVYIKVRSFLVNILRKLHIR